MSRVSYFQRFSQRENHTTNNTLLALRHIYEASPFRAQELLISLLDISFSIGLSFDQQVRGSASVPDAVISQEALRIFVETKRGGSLDEAQIAAHVETIEAQRFIGRRILVGVTKERLAADQFDRCRKLADAAEVTFAAVTFSQIAESLRRDAESHNRDLIAMVEDYDSFIESEGLLEDRARWLPIYPCGDSLAENSRFSLYFEPRSRPSKAKSNYFGVYASKQVRLVGRVETVIICRPNATNTDLEFEWEAGAPLTEAHCTRIRAAIDATPYYDLKEEENRYYLADRLVETRLYKISPQGVPGYRNLDLKELIDNFRSDANLSSEELAAALDGKTFR